MRAQARFPFPARLRPAVVLASVAFLALAAAPAAFAQDGHGHEHGEAAAATEAERAAADALVAATRQGVDRLADVGAAEAEGYVQVTPYSFYGVRAAHFQHPGYAADGALLDPERPESVMYLKDDAGRLELIGVMFLAPIGAGPTPGGPLTAWHTHDDLCAAPAGVVPILPDGTCQPGTGPIPYEMMHVWLVDNEGGPFAHDLDAPGMDDSGSGSGLDPSGMTGGSVAAAASLVDWRALLGDVADLLGLNAAELAVRFQGGQNLEELAAERGVERAELVRLIGRRAAADLNRAVVVGDMTAAQRDLILAGLPAQVERLVTIRAGEPWVRP